MSHTARTTTKTALTVIVVVLAAAGLLLHADVPQVPSNEWAPAGDMTSVRAGASGTLLATGLVLVAGGIDANGATASVERFSPDGAHFIDAASMQSPRANHTATLLADGRLLVAGGTGASGAAGATAEIYDSTANAWLPAGSLNVARRGHTATRLPDGKVLIAGGDDAGVAIASLEIFDPATTLFTVVDGASSGARTLHSAAALFDGRVLIAGGFDGTNPLASTSIYDPEANTVSAGPDLSTPRSGLTATTLIDGRVLVAGGVGASGELASAEIFDPATTTFTSTDNTLSSARQNHLAILLPHNNQVLILGGLAGGSSVAAAEYFTPWEGTNGVFCADVICASGYAGPMAPAAARAWATASALSYPADTTIRTGPNDGLLVLAGGSGQQSAELFGFATVKTDKEDYAPGTTVRITGGGWKPHEFVALVLREAPLFDEHPLLDVEADDNGNISSEEFVPDEHDIGIRFYLTAYGEESQAQTTFRDNINVNAATIQMRNAACSSAQATFSQGDSVCAHVVITGTTGSGAGDSFVIQWLNPSSTVDTPPSTTETAPSAVPTTFDRTFVTNGTTVTGNWTVRVCKTAVCNGGNLIASATFTLNAPANTAPTADAKAASTNEDSALGVTLTGSDPETCELTFSIVSPPANGSLGLITDSACVAGSPNIDSASVTYTPTGNFNGSDGFTYRVNDGVANSSDATVSITVNAVNDVPSFTKGANPTVLEDAAAQSVVGWATAISAGPSNESGQIVNFIVSNDNNTLFSVPPAVAANGTLTYATAPNANGSATVSVQIHDNGGTLNGGVDTSLAQTFTISVTAVNDAPSFTKGADQTVGEDAGAQTVSNWATAITAGPPNESGQSVNFFIDTNSNSSLFSAQPAVSPTGTLSYTPAANANGSATITLHIHDDGGTTNGGENVSATQSFLITVTSVNDAPSFTKGADQTVLEDSGAHSVSGWATAVSAGPTNESDQLVDFVINSNTNSALFSVQPAVSPTGTLTFTSAPDANGSATITLHIHDNGGTANGGIDVSPTQTFTVTVTDVNDAPSFTKGADETVLEDSGAASYPGWASASAGPNESQAVDFVIDTNSNPALFSLPPAVSGGGTLSFTPASNANGSATITLHIHDDGGTANGGVDASASQSFVIHVTAVNDAPSFTKGDDQTVLEDAGAQTVNAWATAFSAGPADEAGQVLTFDTNNDNTALFSAQPSIAANGTLTYAPAANANGTATVTIMLHDNGGTANGGVDTSAPQMFTITVTAVNDPPSFTKGADQTVLEDSGAHSVGAWATAISAGPANESGQAVNFTVSNDNNSLFSSQPAVAADGTLTFTPAGNANGTATVMVQAHDDGGTANGGVDTSASQMFAITVTPVNDAPSFTKGADQSVAEDSGPQSTAGWATALSTGPADESGQTVNFVIDSSTNAALFSTQPAVSPAGTLTYTPAANANGTATITLHIHDNGGTANGGVDSSATQTFVINVTAVNDAPSFTKGPNQTVLEDAGAQSVSGWATAISAGPADESGQAVDFVIDSNTNTALFSSQPAVDASGNLTYTPAANANGSAMITLHIHDNGGTANGGLDSSATQMFVINVTAVNDAPGFTKGTDQTVLEDSASQSISGWATGISAGPGDESGQLVNFAIDSNTNTGLFSAQPAVSATGTLTYTPAANANGSATITLHIHDNGGTANGGVDSSATQMFVINVTAVNDAPSFTKGANQTVIVNAGAQNVAGWATALSPGPGDEVGQALNFIVNNNNNVLFAVQPAVAANGTLTFTPATNAAGIATVTLQLHDNGGTLNGGQDISVTQTFTINILYSTGSCLGEAGHQILQPINADGSSVSKRNSTVPAKFRVCDASGHSIGAPGVVTDFRISQVINGTVTTSVNEVPDSTTPDTAFRWSPTDQLWIYNVNTKDSFFQTNRTYVFNITLSDGSIIPFQFGLR